MFDHPDLLHAWAAKPVYRIVGVGHSANSTALDLLSNFVATTPAAAGAHLADLLRNARETQQVVANLRTENEELRVRVRERDNQLQHIAVVDHSETQPTPVTAHEQDAPTHVGKALALALIIGIIMGIIVVMLFLHRR